VTSFTASQIDDRGPFIEPEIGDHLVHDVRPTGIEADGHRVVERFLNHVVFVMSERITRAHQRMMPDRRAC
jgi:hypothetical protein